jgi:hypothetical protein
VQRGLDSAAHTGLHGAEALTAQQQHGLERTMLKDKREAIEKRIHQDREVSLSSTIERVSWLPPSLKFCPLDVATSHEDYAIPTSPFRPNQRAGPELLRTKRGSHGRFFHGDSSQPL